MRSPTWCCKKIRACNSCTLKTTSVLETVESRDCLRGLHGLPSSRSWFWPRPILVTRGRRSWQQCWNGFLWKLSYQIGICFEAVFRILLHSCSKFNMDVIVFSQCFFTHEHGRFGFRLFRALPSDVSVVFLANKTSRYVQSSVIFDVASPSYDLADKNPSLN